MGGTVGCPEWEKEKNPKNLCLLRVTVQGGKVGAKYVISTHLDKQRRKLILRLSEYVKTRRPKHNSWENAICLAGG